MHQQLADEHGDKDRESSISNGCVVAPDPQVSPAKTEDIVKPKEVSVPTSGLVPTVQERQLGEIYNIHAWKIFDHLLEHIHAV